MKMRAVMSLGLAVLLSSWLARSAEEQRVTPTQVFMRQKVAYSQKIVEGVALEHYDVVLTNTLYLWRMSQTNSWTILHNPVYREKTAQFQVDAVALIDAARAKNTAQVLDAYARVTADCVSCHQSCRREQYVRQHELMAPKPVTAQKVSAEPNTKAEAK